MLARAQEEISFLRDIVSPDTLEPISILIMTSPHAVLLPVDKEPIVLCVLDVINQDTFTLHFVLDKRPFILKLIQIINQLPFSPFEVVSELASILDLAVGSNASTLTMQLPAIELPLEDFAVGKLKPP